VARHLFTLVPSSRIFLPRRLRRHIPPKRRLTQDLHGATSQKSVFFIVNSENVKSYIRDFIIYTGHFVLFGRSRILSWTGYEGRGRENKLHLQKFGEENS
jgi:hypothetical protein